MSVASPTLQFLGAAGTVTGSRFLVCAGASRVLVDCGLFQGPKKLRLRNWEAFPVEPETIDAVVLTHAHVDHSGYLPGLVRWGFRGRVFSTRGTQALCRVVLPDSGRLHEEDASYARRKGFSKHDPPLPLYTEEDAHQALGLFETVPFDRVHEIAAGIGAIFRPAGHILGSAHVELVLEGPHPRRIVFSGDLGRPAHPLLVPPAPLPEADQVVVESTYGDRRHQQPHGIDMLAETVARTVERGGVMVIPAFAVDRTEIILDHLRTLIAQGRIPKVPIFVDSPMAVAALEVYREAIEGGWDDVRPERRGQPAPFDTGDLHEVRNVEASRQLQDRPGPLLIVSASGMATGGRVIHHLATRLPDARNTIALVGYQAIGTRGRRLLEGERAVKMLGRYVPVRAEIADLSEFSVHADGDELIAWLGTRNTAPDVAFVVHGEPGASHALAKRIDQELGWLSVVPSLGERVQI